jgi:DNA repair exonuclease SbcCD ATPase subunit
MKLDELLTTLEDARQSLQNWQEQRTDALMSLDAIRVDLETLEREKKEIESNLISLQVERSESETQLHTQIIELQNQNAALVQSESNLRLTLADQN